jgi:hypothetical protein
MTTNDDLAGPAFAPWPPPTYYTTGSPVPSGPHRIAEVRPLDDRIRVGSDGTRRVQYQLPEVPVAVGRVFISGYLRTTASGQVLSPNGQVVGQIDFDSGIFTIDVDRAPGSNSRIVEYVFPRPLAASC